MKLDYKILLEKRNDDFEIYEHLPNWLRKVYIFRFEKVIEGVNKKFIKVGKTDFKEVHDRLIFNHHAFVEGIDKWVDTSMFEYFDELIILSSVQLKTTIADKLEKDILRAWGGKSDVKLPKLGGMSEIFSWTKQRETIAREAFEKKRYKK